MQWTQLPIHDWQKWMILPPIFINAKLFLFQSYYRHENRLKSYPFKLANTSIPRHISKNFRKKWVHQNEVQWHCHSCLYNLLTGSKSNEGGIIVPGTIHGKNPTSVKSWHFRFSFPCCDAPGQCLNLRSEGTCWPKYPLQDEGRFANGPCCIFGFPCHISRKCPERFSIAPELVSSDETRPVPTKRLEFDYLSC